MGPQNAKRRPEGRRRSLPDQSSTEVQDTASGARREALRRLHSVRVVAEAIDEGIWEIEFDIVDALAHLVDAAVRDLMVADLEAVS
jgi:hypothetical protein